MEVQGLISFDGPRAEFLREDRAHLGPEVADVVPEGTFDA